MAELNESGHFPNFTNNSLHTPARACTGSWPTTNFQIATVFLLMTFSLLGNLLVVAAFYRNKTLRTAVHYFIVNMAISDIIVAVIYMPWWISYKYHGFWLVDGVLGTVLCKLGRITWGLSTFVSIFSMIAIASDRFRAVLFPMSSTLFSRHKRRLTIAATWIVSLACWAHNLYGAKLVPYGTGHLCLIQWEPASYTREVLKITWISTLCLSSVSAIALTVLYSGILISLQRQKNNLHLATEEIKKRALTNRKVAHMLVIIVFVFYVVWLPYHIVYFIAFSQLPIKLNCFIFWLCDKFPLLYPVVNPVVYYIFNEQYHQGFRELLCCPWLCIDKCNDCLNPPVPPQDENNVHDAEQVKNSTKNTERKEH